MFVQLAVSLGSIATQLSMQYNYAPGIAVMIWIS